MFFSAAAPDLINELEPLSAAIAILDPAGRAALLDDPRMLRTSRFAAAARRVKRYVAIKPTGAGMDPRQLLARFDAERQARALMDLANITGLLDGGLHEQGPIFVAEPVKVVPITESCDRRRLSPKRRLDPVSTRRQVS